ncbi:GYD domain-containing protein, partial [Mesorhizobium sp. M7A.F.Ca.CA.002.03.2.1]
MTSYIVLMNWTEQGARNVRESPKRLDAARKQLGDMGGSFKAFYMTMG